MPTPALLDIFYLRTRITSSHKRPIRVLTATLARVRVLDASRSIPTLFSLATPVEDPIVGVLLKGIARRSLTGIRAAGTVGRTVVLVVLVVGLEDGVGLGFGGAGVVRALGRLDCGGDFGAWMVLDVLH